MSSVFVAPPRASTSSTRTGGDHRQCETPLSNAGGVENMVRLWIFFPASEGRKRRVLPLMMRKFDPRLTCAQLKEDAIRMMIGIIPYGLPRSEFRAELFKGKEETECPDDVTAVAAEYRLRLNGNFPLLLTRAFRVSRLRPANDRFLSRNSQLFRENIDECLPPGLKGHYITCIFSGQVSEAVEGCHQVDHHLHSLIVSLCQAAERANMLDPNGAPIEFVDDGRNGIWLRRDLHWDWDERKFSIAFLQLPEFKGTIQSCSEPQIFLWHNRHNLLKLCEAKGSGDSDAVTAFDRWNAVTPFSPNLWQNLVKNQSSKSPHLFFLLWQHARCLYKNTATTKAKEILGMATPGLGMLEEKAILDTLEYDWSASLKFKEGDDYGPEGQDDGMRGQDDSGEGGNDNEEGGGGHGRGGGRGHDRGGRGGGGGGGGGRRARGHRGGDPSRSSNRLAGKAPGSNQDSHEDHLDFTMLLSLRVLASIMEEKRRGHFDWDNVEKVRKLLEDAFDNELIIPTEELERPTHTLSLAAMVHAATEPWIDAEDVDTIVTAEGRPESLAAVDERVTTSESLKDDLVTPKPQRQVGFLPTPPTTIHGPRISSTTMETPRAGPPRRRDQSPASDHETPRPFRALIGPLGQGSSEASSPLPAYRPRSTINPFPPIPPAPNPAAELEVPRWRREPQAKVHEENGDRRIVIAGMALLGLFRPLDSSPSASESKSFTLGDSFQFSLRRGTLDIDAYQWFGRNEDVQDLIGRIEAQLKLISHLRNYDGETEWEIQQLKIALGIRMAMHGINHPSTNNDPGKIASKVKLRLVEGGAFVNLLGRLEDPIIPFLYDDVVVAFGGNETPDRFVERAAGDTRETAEERQRALTFKRQEERTRLGQSLGQIREGQEESSLPAIRDDKDFEWGEMVEEEDDKEDDANMGEVEIVGGNEDSEESEESEEDKYKRENTGEGMSFNYDRKE